MAGVEPVAVGVGADGPCSHASVWAMLPRSTRGMGTGGCIGGIAGKGPGGGMRRRAATGAVPPTGGAAG